MNNIVNSYQNGSSYVVNLYEDGTKERVYLDDNDVIIQPETIDIKITNYCDMGCKYCHEASTERGKHGDLLTLANRLEGLERGTELAIGGGNPLSHPALNGFLAICRQKGWIANLTVNMGHISKILKDSEEKKKFDNILKNANAIGISYNINEDFDEELFKDFIKENGKSTQIVMHLIAGVNGVKEIEHSLDLGVDRILLLGYKTFGFGKNFKRDFGTQIETKINEIRWDIVKYLHNDKIVMSFDNLAIEQIKPQRFFTKEYFDKHYMGDDFTFSMYIDTVLGYYSPTSRSPQDQRIKWDNMSLKTYFQNNRGTFNEN